MGGWILAPGAGAKNKPAAAVGPVPMPDATNRPTFNSGNNTLSWKGPVGGGPSNGSYVQQSRVLTVVGGQVVSTGDNTIIEGVYATGNPAIRISHNNVTVRQSFAQVTPANTDSTYCVFADSGVTGLVVEDCFLDGNATSNEGNGVSGTQTAGPGLTNAIVRRCNGFQIGQLVRFILNSVSVTENWCHVVSGADADYVEVYPVGGVCNHLLIQYNNFEGIDNAVAGADSGVNLSTGAGLPGGTIGPDVVIDSNWFTWASTTQSGAWRPHSIVNGVGGAVGGNPEILEFTCTNNGIYNVAGSYGAGNSTLLGAPSSGSPTSGGGLVHDSGNYIMATPTSTSGVPYVGINGAGRL